MVLADVFSGEEEIDMAMSEEEKYYLFTTGCRKILFLMTETGGDEFWSLCPRFGSELDLGIHQPLAHGPQNLRRSRMVEGGVSARNV